MTNWKTYIIRNVDNRGGWIRFELNDGVTYSDGTYNRIDCKNTYPYSSCQRGEQLEIDLDVTRYRSSGHDFTNTSEVRKTTLALIPGTSAYGSSLANRSTRLDVSEIRNQVDLVNNTNRKGYSDERVWRDSSGEYYENIEYTKDYASYQRTRKW